MTCRTSTVFIDKIGKVGLLAEGALIARMGLVSTTSEVDASLKNILMY